MMVLTRERNYWENAGPAIISAVEKRNYFKNLIKLCSTIPNEKVFYILSLELCRWLDEGESMESFISWISCSPTGTIRDKAIILDQLLPGTTFTYHISTVELGAMLDTVIEEYKDQVHTLGWGLMTFMTKVPLIVNMSTCLYNGYSKGFAFYLSLYFHEMLDSMYKSKSVLDVVYGSYRRQCYSASQHEPPIIKSIPTDQTPTPTVHKHVTSRRAVKSARLTPGVTPDEVRKILTDAGLGRHYIKSGEWAAAFRALFVTHVLIGTAPEVMRWAIDQQYVEDSAKETIKKAWSGEWNEAGQFYNASQQTVFRTVLAAATSLLTTNRL
jgi:hypothetical protein